IERNPALEVLEDSTTVPLENPEEGHKEEDDYFEATSDSGFVRQSGIELADANQRFIEGVLTHPQTLQDHLLWQLQLQPIDDELRVICESLIQNLDDDGFHIEAPETLFRPAPPVRLAEALALVQTLDPQGSCTSDYMESLKVQIGLLPDAAPGMVQALAHLEPLEKGRFADVAKIIGCTSDEARGYFRIIKQLDPFPGRNYSSAASSVRYVVPDIQIAQKEGDFVIILNEEEIPVLGINPFFMKLSGDGKDDKPARDFVRENIREARWFIHTVNQRNHTLLRVTRAILEFQRPFFVNGPKYLTPLTLRDISKELGIHETTVSRVANGKYVQTEWGIFELRHFFSNSISGTGSGGSRYSKEGVKEIIREMLSGGNANLSDQEISEILAGKGITLARRTVAKYRKELELGSSYTR
ncbi:MAG: RNA polymerase factor sigma-54, partial [Treponema sp.]|nr:RNA polymerase factor sigma-54 [Treponema sp.]